MPTRRALPAQVDEHGMPRQYFLREMVAHVADFESALAEGDEQRLRGTYIYRFGCGGPT
jgi:hypothetical protein